jgi:hypothetical protein
MKKKRQEEIKEAGRRRRKEGEREKKEKGREIARCFCFWPEDRNVRRRLAVLECGFLLFSVSGNADAGVSLITIRALRGRRSSSKMRLFAVSLSGLNTGM